jgi:Iron permease FTR1 family
VNCCNPEDTSNGGWGIFNAILGWQNSATIGSVVSYCIYWIFVTLALIVMRVDERRVSKGKATLWRTILRKGPKIPKEGNGIVVEGPVEVRDDNIKKSPHTGIERDIQNLAV